MSFICYRQLNAMDCGPTCLRMVAKFHGLNIHAARLRQAAGFSKEGVCLLGLSEVAENLGFRTRGVQINTDEILHQACCS